MKIILLTIYILFLYTSSAFAETASYYTIKSCHKEGSSGITASSEPLNDNNFTAASWDFSFNTILKVTNLNNGKYVFVRVNDRGPSRKLYKQGRIIDLSKAAFEKLADLKEGVIPIKIETIMRPVKTDTHSLSNPSTQAKAGRRK